MLLRDVIGQSDAKSRLVKMVQENRISHALLFLGAEGWGSLPLALAFAQYIVCEQKSSKFKVQSSKSEVQSSKFKVQSTGLGFEEEPVSETILQSSVTDACGKCNACLKMNKLVHPDVSFSFPIASTGEDSKKPKKCVDELNEWRTAVLENPYLNGDDWYNTLGLLNKQGIIPTEESGDIIRRLSLKPVESPYKIVIIWLPEKLHVTAANKLLKIIEEPPEQTLFFLVAENYEAIIPTILSRTQLIKLNRLTDKEIEDALMMGNDVEHEKAKRLARRAGGDYREALYLVYHLEAEQNDNHRFLEWMRMCWKIDLSKLGDMMDELAGEGREKQKLFLRNGLHLVRECLMLNYAHHSMISFEGKELEDFKKLARFITHENSTLIMDAFDQAHYHIERNANFKIAFTDLSFSMNRLLNHKS